MGLIDKLRAVGGKVKNRLASSIGALKGVTVSAGRARRGVRFAARATRLTSPVGIGLTALSFGPEILRGAGAAGRFLQRAVPRGIAFVSGQRVVSGIAGGLGAGAVAGGIAARTSGGVIRPSDFGDPSLQSRVPGPTSTQVASRIRQAGLQAGRTATARRRRVSNGTRKTRRVTKRKTKAEIKRQRIKNLKKARAAKRKGKRRTHRSPRHKGHKRVSFTTAQGKKVSFLVNPKARHR